MGRKGKERIWSQVSLTFPNGWGQKGEAGEGQGRHMSSLSEWQKHLLVTGAVPRSKGAGQRLGDLTICLGEEGWRKSGGHWGQWSSCMGAEALLFRRTAVSEKRWVGFLCVNPAVQGWGVRGWAGEGTCSAGHNATAPPLCEPRRHALPASTGVSPRQGHGCRHRAKPGSPALGKTAATTPRSSCSRLPASASSGHSSHPHLPTGLPHCSVYWEKGEKWVSIFLFKTTSTGWSRLNLGDHSCFSI